MASPPLAKSPAVRGIQAGRANLPSDQAQSERRAYGFPTTALDRPYTSPVSFPTSTAASRLDRPVAAQGFAEDPRSATPSGRLESALLQVGSRPGLMSSEAGMGAGNYARAAEKSPRELRVAEQAAADSFYEKRELDRTFAPLFGMPGYYTGTPPSLLARGLGALVGPPKAATQPKRTYAREDNPQFPAILARKKIDEAAAAGNMPAAARIYAQAAADKERLTGLGVGKPILSLVRSFGAPHVRDVDTPELVAPSNDSDREIRKGLLSMLRRPTGLPGLLNSGAKRPPDGISDVAASPW